MGLLSELTINRDYCSPVEKKIAEQITRDPDAFISLSIAELAERAGVSQGSIHNFSKKFVSGGFSDLKLRIAQELSSFEARPFSIVGKKSTLDEILQTNLAETAECLTHTVTMNRSETLEMVAEKLMHARRVDIYGVFQSSFVAQNFCYQLVQLGIPATHVSDTLMCSVSAASTDEHCVVLAISGSGKTREILEAVRVARDRKPYIIGLTGNKFSPLAKLSDCVLTTASGLSESTRTDQTRASQMFLLDALASYLRCRQDAMDNNMRYTMVQKILNSHSVEE